MIGKTPPLDGMTSDGAAGVDTAADPDSPPGEVGGTTIVLVGVTWAVLPASPASPSEGSSAGAGSST